MLVCFKLESGGLLVSGIEHFKTTFNSVPLPGLAFSDGDIFASSPCPNNGGIFVLPSAQSSLNEPLPKKILSNCSTTCGTAHGICATNDKRVIFTDTSQKKVRYLDLESGEVNVVAGTGQDGTSDGSLMTASFTQPSGICREGYSLFMVD